MPPTQKDWGHRTLLFIRLEGDQKPCVPMFLLPIPFLPSLLGRVSFPEIQNKTDISPVREELSLMSLLLSSIL